MSPPLCLRIYLIMKAIISEPNRASTAEFFWQWRRRRRRRRFDNAREIEQRCIFLLAQQQIGYGTTAAGSWIDAKLDRWMQNSGWSSKIARRNTRLWNYYKFFSTRSELGLNHDQPTRISARAQWQRLVQRASLVTSTKNGICYEGLSRVLLP